MSKPAVRLGLLGLLYASHGLGPGLVAFALPVILRREGMSLEAIGLTTLLFWPLALKFLLGPLFDRLQAGDRPRWGVVELTIGSTLCLALMTWTPPGTALWQLVALLFVLNLLAAAKSVAEGGLTMRIVKPDERRWASALSYAGYYAASILAGGVLLAVEIRAGWTIAIAMLAAASLVAVAAALALRRSPPLEVLPPPRQLREYLPSLSLWPILLVAFVLDLPHNAGIVYVGPTLVDAGLPQESIAILTGGGGLAAAIAGALVAAFAGARLRRGGRLLLLLALLQAGALLPIAAIARAGETTFPAAAFAVCLSYATAAAFNVSLLAWFMDRISLTRSATELALLVSVHNLSYVAAGPLAGFSTARTGLGGHLTIVASVAALTAVILMPLIARQMRVRDA